MMVTKTSPSLPPRTKVVDTAPTRERAWAIAFDVRKALNYTHQSNIWNVGVEERKLAKGRTFYVILSPKDDEDEKN